MASFNITVEDSSPLITYAPAGSWTDTPADDPLAASYFGGSYHTAAAQGATATITFTGTGFSIIGGHRSNYGTYSVSVDGQTTATGTAQSSDSVTKQLLGSASGLSYGSHTVVLTNTGGTPIDIDRIDFEAQVGQPGAVGVQKTFDDNDPAITYGPSSSAWQTSSNSGFVDGTLHFSQTPGASASMTFQGDAVAVYGTMSPDHANIQVALDGNSQTMPGGSGGLTSALHTQYYRSDLGPGQHTLVVSGDSQATTGPFIDLDSILVFDGAVSGATSSGFIPSATPAAENTAAIPSPSTTSVPSSASQSSSSRMSTGALVGAVLGGLIAFAFLLGVLGFLFLRRRRRKRLYIEKSMISVSPILPMQGDPKALEAGIRTLENPVFPLPPPKASPSMRYTPPSMRHSIAPSYYSDPEFAGHSRGGSTMSSQSTVPLVPPVPMLNVPQARIPRKPAPARSGFDVNGSPARPSNRPPTMDFTIMESYRD
ncbi:hypothetical protein GALMADRAFT_249097 [Galerina marginata CBS 339.88]|uniref:Transmembrane protein n=1 Tax=Galerina marginata (strain CBS 339.88) TaxID=685588 RepID=A0A067T5F6_GALM3|nr:hypothetical protein GALMADRAFT_249097 [Galerina marginata CBS 339.88]